MRLSQEQFYTVLQAFKYKILIFQKDLPEYTEAAKILSKDVGFDVSVSTIKKIMSLTNFSWMPKNYQDHAHNTQIKKSRLKELENIVVKMGVQLNQQQRLLKKLCDELGVKVEDI